MKNTIDFLNKKIKDFDTIIVACSGGPDSMALLDLICKLKKENLKIICAHVNHNVRKESIFEEKLVKDFCDKKNIIFESMTIEKIEKSNFEMEARKIRYEFFEKLVEKYKAKYLLTAHHGDDLIETILMRLNRGSIIKGYRGIDLISEKKDYEILRPLLFCTKKDLENYVKNNNILYAIDYTNEENEHTRNRFRHYVIPFLKQENPNVHLKYKSFSEELKLYDDFIEKYIKNNCSEILVDNKIDIKKFQNEDILIQRKMVEKLLNNIYDGYLEVITKQHVEQILKLIDINITNKRIDLPDNYMAIIDYGYLKITKKINNENYNLIFKEDLELNSQKFCIVDNSLEKSNYVLRLNSNEIKLPLHIRSRKNGDKILVKNLNNYKKVSDILTDEKIDFQLREQILLVTDDDDNILWVPGIKKSNFDKEKNEICDIIVKYILIKEENNDYKK